MESSRLHVCRIDGLRTRFRVTRSACAACAQLRDLRAKRKAAMEFRRTSPIEATVIVWYGLVVGLWRCFGFGGEPTPPE